MRKFTKPEDAGLELPANLVATWNFVESQIRSRVLEFEVPYNHKKNTLLITPLLADSGWRLEVDQDENGKTLWRLWPQ